MIRINLLGDVPRPKRGKHPAAVSMGGGGEGPSLLIVGLLVAALTVGGNFFWWQKLNKDKAEITRQMQEAEQESRRLATVKASVEEAERQERSYRSRVDVIDQLRAKQSGPVDLLSMVGSTVNSTDAVWLTSVKEEGGNISIQGSALSLNAVANLMQNLKRSGYFKNVEIKESFQDESVKEMQAFLFTLVCERKS